MDNFRITDYNEKDKDAFERLNTEWISRYFELEENDLKAFRNPREEIIDRGGRIFYLYRNGEVIGTVSLVFYTDQMYELSKMAVTEKAKGLGAGNLLLQYAIDAARKKGIKKLFLIGNRKLEPSIHLYRKYGFYEVPLGNQSYKRGDIKMELDL